MIIDADVHISPFEEPGRITVEELVRRMDDAQVNRAVTWLQPHYFRDIDKGNRYIYKASINYPQRVIGFGWVDPHYGIELAKDVVHRCVEEYGFPGVKLNGAQNEFYIDDEKISFPIIDEIVKLNRILAFHIGTDAYESTHPYRLGKIAERYPDTPILAVHMGGVAHRDLTNAMVDVAKTHKNIFLIGSAVKTLPILNAIKELGASRVCFGSDTPFELMHVEIARYTAMLKNLDPNDFDLVMGGNISMLLGKSV